MIEAVILFLIYVLIVALLIYLVIYVLGVIGVPLPGKAIQILWAIFGLIVILLLLRLVVSTGGVHLPGL